MARPITVKVIGSLQMLRTNIHRDKIGRTFIHGFPVNTLPGGGVSYEIYSGATDTGHRGGRGSTYMHAYYNGHVPRSEQIRDGAM